MPKEAMRLATGPVSLPAVWVDRDGRCAILDARAWPFRFQQNLPALRIHHCSGVPDLDGLGVLLHSLGQVTILESLGCGGLRCTLGVHLLVGKLDLARWTFVWVGLRVLRQPRRVLLLRLFRLIRLLGFLLLFFFHLRRLCRFGRSRLRLRLSLSVRLGSRRGLRRRHLRTPAQHKVLEEGQLRVIDQRRVLLELGDKSLHSAKLCFLHHRHGREELPAARSKSA
mmetsp:Transcript_55766/g.122469  ORF Transcript_55766/g.122469 Transcript_55766/m.122469 type:complete len:225 (-) Transcript_55766:22-696(-)